MTIPSSLALLGIFAAYALFACTFVQSGGEQGLPSNFGAQNALNHHELDIRRSEFTSDFVFGSATSAGQIEGATKDGGRGPSVADYFFQRLPDNIRSKQDNGIDSYRRYKEDVKALKDLGVDSYRFSISWTRILPNGSLSGGINQLGIDYYNRVIDEVIRNGIIPFVGIFHFDSPQALQEKIWRSLKSSLCIFQFPPTATCFFLPPYRDDFKDYARICFETFGDRVKNWVTINEPLIISRFGYDTGSGPPGRCSNRLICVAGNSSTEPYTVAHNLLLAHATAVRLYKDKFQSNQGGQIGLTLVGVYFMPYSNSPDDKTAAKRAMDFDLGWFMEPLVYGDYPKVMKKIVKDRLPTFTAEEKKLIRKSFDFIGVNYYTSRYASSLPIDLHALPISSIVDQFVNVTVDKDGVLIGPKAEGIDFIYIYPIGLQELLVSMKKYYQNPTIYITENGVTEKNLPLEVAIKDEHRINFIAQHLFWLHKAIFEERVNVKGYFYWSAFDDVQKFGLHYIDFKNNLSRVPKHSALWFQGFLKG